MTLPDYSENHFDEPEEVEEDLTDQDVFVAKVNHIYEMIHNDETKKDRMLAEIYVFMATMDQSIRTVVKMGPMHILSKMAGGKSGQS